MFYTHAENEPLLCQSCTFLLYEGKVFQCLCDTGSVATIIDASEFPPRGIPRYTPAKQVAVCVRDVSGRNSMVATILVHTADYPGLAKKTQTLALKRRKACCPWFTGEETRLLLSLLAVDATEASILRLARCAPNPTKIDQQSLLGLCIEYRHIFNVDDKTFVHNYTCHI